MEKDTNVRDSGILERVASGYVVNDRYEITRKLGAGGFAVVFLGRDLQIERNVAIKVMSTQKTVTDPEVRQQLLKRFRREASLAGRIDHPNVLNIYDYGVIDEEGDPFIVMEHLEGHDLETQLRRSGAMEPGHIIPLFIDALVALGVAHEHGIVHKDLKPSNLFLKRPGTRLEALCILDFGIAHIEREVRSRLTQAGQLMGTPAYLPPEYSTEQIVTPMLDVYQMGLILIEAMTGEAVVQHSEPMAAMFQHVRGQLKVPKVLMESPLGPVLESALALDHDARFGDGLEFADALAAVPADSIPALGSEFEVVALSQGDGAENSQQPAEQEQTIRQTNRGTGGEERGDSSTRIVYGGVEGMESEKDSSLLVDQSADQTPSQGGLLAVEGSGPQPLAAGTQGDVPEDGGAEDDSAAGERTDLMESGPKLDGRFSSKTEEEEFDDLTLQMERSGSSKGIALIAMVVVAGVFVGGGLWATGVFDGEPEETDEIASTDDVQEEEEKDDDPLAAGGADEEDEAEEQVGEDTDDTVEISISSKPEGATLFEGDEELGVTPLEVAVGDEEPMEAVLVLQDYEDKEVVISADGQSELTFALEPESESEEVAGVGAAPAGGAGASAGTARREREEVEEDDSPAMPGEEEREDSFEEVEEAAVEEEEAAVDESEEEEAAVDESEEEETALEEPEEEEEEEEEIRLPGF